MTLDHNWEGSKEESGKERIRAGGAAQVFGRNLDGIREEKAQRSHRGQLEGFVLHDLSLAQITQRRQKRICEMPKEDNEKKILLML